MNEGRLIAPYLTPERLYLIDKKRRDRDIEEQEFARWRQERQQQEEKRRKSRTMTRRQIVDLLMRETGCRLREANAAFDICSSSVRVNDE